MIHITASTSEDPFPVPTAEQLEQDIPENGKLIITNNNNRKKIYIYIIIHHTDYSCLSFNRQHFKALQNW